MCCANAEIRLFFYLPSAFLFDIHFAHSARSPTLLEIKRSRAVCCSCSETEAHRWFASASRVRGVYDDLLISHVNVLMGDLQRSMEQNVRLVVELLKQTTRLRTNVPNSWPTCGRSNGFVGPAVPCLVAARDTANDQSVHNFDSFVFSVIIHLRYSLVLCIPHLFCFAFNISNISLSSGFKCCPLSFIIFSLRGPPSGPPKRSEGKKSTVFARSIFLRQEAALCTTKIKFTAFVFFFMMETLLISFSRLSKCAVDLIALLSCLLRLQLHSIREVNNQLFANHLLCFDSGQSSRSHIIKF